MSAVSESPDLGMHDTEIPDEPDKDWCSKKIECWISQDHGRCLQQIAEFYGIDEVAAVEVAIWFTYQSLGRDLGDAG